MFSIVDRDPPPDNADPLDPFGGDLTARVREIIASPSYAEWSDELAERLSADERDAWERYGNDFGGEG
jgi:hypothetical protein